MKALQFKMGIELMTFVLWGDSDHDDQDVRMFQNHFSMNVLCELLCPTISVLDLATAF